MLLVASVKNFLENQISTSQQQNTCQRRLADANDWKKIFQFAGCRFWVKHFCWLDLHLNAVKHGKHPKKFRNCQQNYHAFSKYWTNCPLQSFFLDLRIKSQFTLQSFVACLIRVSAASAIELDLSSAFMPGDVIVFHPGFFIVHTWRNFFVLVGRRGSWWGVGHSEINSPSDPGLKWFSDSLRHG